MEGALGVSQTVGRGEQCEKSVSGAESTRLGDEEMDAVRFDRLSELPAALFQTCSSIVNFPTLWCAQRPKVHEHDRHTTSTTRWVGWDRTDVVRR